MFIHTYTHTVILISFLEKVDFLFLSVGDINENINPSFSIDLYREINLPHFSLLFQRLIREKVQYKNLIWSKIKKNEI